MYDAPVFVPPVAKSTKADRIVAAVTSAVKNVCLLCDVYRHRSQGVENWQINMAVDEQGVRLLRCMKLDLLPHLANAASE
jgi:hypothetical protein